MGSNIVAGPIFGPIIGSALLYRDASWRWAEILTGIYMLVIWILDVLILDESFPPTLLVYKARRLRINTGNWSLHTRHEEWDVSVKEMIHKFGIVR